MTTVEATAVVSTAVVDTLGTTVVPTVVTSPRLPEHPLVLHRDKISFGAGTEALGHPKVHDNRHVQVLSDDDVLRAQVVVADSLNTAAAVAGRTMCMPVSQEHTE